MPPKRDAANNQPEPESDGSRSDEAWADVAKTFERMQMEQNNRWQELFTSQEKRHEQQMQTMQQFMEKFMVLSSSPAPASPAATTSHAAAASTPSTAESSYNAVAPDDDTPNLDGNQLVSPQGGPTENFQPEIDVINQRQQQHQRQWEERQQRRANARANDTLRAPPRSLEPPVAKMPTFDGKEDWDSFAVPFERLSRRHGWGPVQQLDRLHECLRGAAASFASLQPEHIRENYVRLCLELKQRFGRKEPPATARRKLNEYLQTKETLEEYAEQIRRLVTRAFPDNDPVFQEELAAEAFLRGYRNSKVAYQAMNRDPKTLAEAQQLVEVYEHNYKTTVGRHAEAASRHRARQVTWASQDQDPADSAHEVCRVSTPNYVSSEHLDQRLTSMKTELISTMKELLMRPLDPTPPANAAPAQYSLPRAPSPHPRGRSPSRGKCFACGETGHFRRECSRSPSPAPKPAGNE